MHFYIVRLGSMRVDDVRCDKKKDVLEYLGKRGNDYKAYQRLVEKGVIVEYKGMYSTRTNIQRKKIKMELPKKKELEDEIRRYKNIVDGMKSTILERGEK